MLCSVVFAVSSFRAVSKSSLEICYGPVTASLTFSEKIFFLRKALVVKVSASQVWHPSSVFSQRPLKQRFKAWLRGSKRQTDKGGGRQTIVFLHLSWMVPVRSNMQGGMEGTRASTWYEGRVRSEWERCKRGEGSQSQRSVLFLCCQIWGMSCFQISYVLSLNFTRLHAPLLEDMIAFATGQISLRSPRSELQSRRGHEHLPPLLLGTLEDFVRTFTLDNRTSHP